MDQITLIKQSRWFICAVYSAIHYGVQENGLRCTPQSENKDSLLYIDIYLAN